MSGTQNNKPLRFKDRVAIVSGGGSGIGKAISQRFLDDGATVMVAQRRPSPIGEHIDADLSDAQCCEQVIETAASRYGRIDILVNNAGMMMESAIEETSLEEWQRNLAINLTAPFLLTKYALPYLKKQGGSIVNIGSVEGLGANPLHSAYCASKGGLHALTRAVAVDHGIDGIRCNAVAPGWVDTALNLDFIQSQPDPDRFREKIGTIHPVGPHRHTRGDR